jgi:hypothetical protein
MPFLFSRYLHKMRKQAGQIAFMADKFGGNKFHNQDINDEDFREAFNI